VNNACLFLFRGEFDLGFVGFDETYIFLLDNAHGTLLKKGNFNKENLKRINIKMNVALSYQKLLYNILEKVLAKLS